MPLEIPRESALLRIFVGENHRYHHLPLYEAIVLKPREKRLAGATVIRGVFGFGKSSRLHVATPFRVSSDLPVVVELVDSAEKIQGFLTVLDFMIDSGLVTVERAEVLDHWHDPKRHH